MLTSKKRLVWAIGAITSGVLVLMGVFARDALRTEWWRRQAVRECLEPNPEQSSSVWSDILGSEEAGFSCLAKLLRDPDFRVVEDAAERIDKFDEREAVIDFLRRNDSLAFFSYRCFTWAARREPASDARWFTGWSGDGEDSLVLSTQAIDLFESLLRYRPRNPRAEMPPNTDRAVDGLAAMLRPGEVRSPKSPLAARIVEILANSNSFQALNCMVLRSEPEDTWSLIESNEEGAPLRRITEFEWFYMPDLGEWEGFPNKPITIHGVYDVRCFKERNALLALCHADCSTALRAIAHLLRNPEVGPKLEMVASQ